MSNTKPIVDFYTIDADSVDVVAIYKNGSLVYEGELDMPPLRALQSLTEGTVFEVSSGPGFDEAESFPDNENDISDYVTVNRVITYEDMVADMQSEMKALFG